MIIEQHQLEKKPGWSSSEINRWADYIEILCIHREFVAIEDIVEEWLDSDFENKTARGERDHSQKMDNLYLKVIDYFEIIKSREAFCGEYYPFEVRDGKSLVFKGHENEKYRQYIYLLLCSSITFMTSYHEYTESFEMFCKLLVKVLSPKGTVVEIFGTSRESAIFTGSLRERIEQLAKCLGTETTKRFDKNPRFDKIHGGDGGVDIFAFMPIDDAGFIPFSFSQCTCSYDMWKDKQYSIGEERWNAYIELGVHYAQYMFVPFSCHDAQGKFYDNTSIRAFLIDRLRMIKLIEREEFDQREFQNLYSFINMEEFA